MKNIEFQNIELTQKLFGYNNIHLEKISSAFNITINSRGNAISLAGEDNDLAVAEILIRQLYELLQEGFILMPPDQCVKIPSRCETDILPPGKTQDIRKTIELSSTCIGKINGVRGPIHLPLKARISLKTNHRILFR